MKINYIAKEQDKDKKLKDILKRRLYISSELLKKLKYADTIYVIALSFETLATVTVGQFVGNKKYDEIINIVKKKVSEYIITQKEINILEIGKMIYVMGLEYIIIQMEKNMKENGKMI